MVQKRNRFKQSDTLKERLAQFAQKLEGEAATLEPGSEEALNLRKRMLSCSAAQTFNTSLNQDEQ